MKKITYYFLMTLGIISFTIGIFSLVRGGDFNAYFYAIFIGITLVGTTYYNHKQKNKK